MIKKQTMSDEELDKVLICTTDKMVDVLSIFGSIILRENLTEEGINTSAEEFLKNNRRFFL
jgi:hypothetical protein